MGPYCNFCQTRCFAPVKADWPEAILLPYREKGFGIAATCAQGQEYERRKLGVCYGDGEAALMALPAQTFDKPEEVSRAISDGLVEMLLEEGKAGMVYLTDADGPPGPEPMEKVWRFLGDRASLDFIRAFGLCHIDGGTRRTLKEVRDHFEGMSRTADEWNNSQPGVGQTVDYRQTFWHYVEALDRILKPGGDAA